MSEREVEIRGEEAMRMSGRFPVAILAVAFVVVSVGPSFPDNQSSSSEKTKDKKDVKKSTDTAKTDVSKARNTVDRIREADPPEVQKSTDTAKDRADRENAKERERERERAKKNKPKKEVPPPSNK